MPEVRFGPAGIGGVKEAPEVLEQFSRQGIKAAEIPFTYRIWLDNEQAKKIGEIAKKFDVRLSIHAPYYINLASDDIKKVDASKQRILDCCERAHYLNAKYVVFHAAFYGKLSKEECYEVVKKQILEMQKTILKKKFNVVLAPETTGKESQFGSLNELIRLSKETKCFFCIDFAHLLARSQKINYNEVFSKIKNFDEIHSHFSGIEYGEKGEKKHLITTEKSLHELLTHVKRYNLSITIINESPSPYEDSLKAKKIWEKIK